MNSELVPAWRHTWTEIWRPLSKYPGIPDLFMALVEGLAKAPQPPESLASPPATSFDSNGKLANDSAIQARNEFKGALKRYTRQKGKYETALTSENVAKSYFKNMLSEISEEAEAVNFLEESYNVIKSIENDELANLYCNLVRYFLIKFNLRYELRDRFSLHTTIPGLFTKLISEIKLIAAMDGHLSGLMDEFEEAFGDLRVERTQARIKNCLQKQFNLLEGLGRQCPGVKGMTLGAICNDLDWPHASLKEVGKKLYGFRSDYPGVGHGGNPQGVLRNLEMRDFVSLSLMLASFTPYVTHGLDSNRCYSA